MSPKVPCAPPYIYTPTEGADVTIHLEATDDEGRPTFARYRCRVTEVHSDDVVSMEVTGTADGRALPGDYKGPKTFSSVPRARYGVAYPQWRPVIRGGVKNDLPREEGDWEERRAAELKSHRRA